jgi:hypothetical protein
MYIVSIAVAAMYSSTLVLNVHFRGDFGIVTEAIVGPRSGRRLLGCCGPVSDAVYSRRRSISESFPRLVANSFVDCLYDVAAVPYGDLQFLFAPADAVAAHGGLLNLRAESSEVYKDI